MSLFETEDQRKIRDLQRKLDWERYQSETQIRALNNRIEQNAREWSDYASSEREDLQETITELEDKLRRIHEFLKKKFNDEYAGGSAPDE